jgi:hypothetical protein
MENEIERSRSRGEGNIGIDLKELMCEDLE